VLFDCVQSGLQVVLTMNQKSKTIALIGVGGGGMTTIDTLIQDSVTVDKSIVLNRNKLFLIKSKADDKILLEVPRNTPDLMVQAVEAHDANIRELLSGLGAVVLIAGLGGVTGSYATPEIARIAKDMGLIVWAVVVMPFEFEGKRRAREAQKGLDRLSRHTDGVRCIKNQELTVAGRSISMLEAFRPVDTAVEELIRTILNDKCSSPAVIKSSLPIESTAIIRETDDDAGQLCVSTLVCEPMSDGTGLIEVSLDSCCSFCNEPLSKAKRFIFSPPHFICYKCVSLCAQKFSGK